MTTERWWDRAQCIGADPNLFYTRNGAGSDAQIVAAKAICRICPVRTQCLEDALAMPPSQRLVGMIRGGRYFATAKTAADRTEGAAVA